MTDTPTSEPTLFLKPAPGKQVLMPGGSWFPAEGDRVVADLFVRRRIADGDLVPAEPPVES